MRNEKLVVLTGALEGKVIPIKNSISIGRNPDNDLQLDDLQISRQHAIIEQGPEATTLRDLGSGNGTYIGDRRVLEYKLSNGDIMRMGTHELRFEGDASEPAQADAGAAESKPAALEETGPPLSSEAGAGVQFASEPEGKIEAIKAENVFETFFQAPKRSVTEEQLRETQERLKAVYAANEIITSEQNLRKLFERVMEQIFGLIPAHNGVIMLKKEDSEELATEYVRSGSSGTGDTTLAAAPNVRISSSIVNRAFEKGEAILTGKAADDDRFDAGASIITQNISSAMCVPLVHQGERLGVIYVDTRGTTDAFVNSDLELLVALSSAAAIAIKNAQFVDMIERAYEDTLRVLANTIEMKDHYTVGHTWRVTNFTLEIAKELGWDEEKLKEVELGGVMHDIGKIAVEDAILCKPGRLTGEEFAKIKVHPEKGAKLLQEVKHLHPLIPYALYHHERFDGNGYPYGLKGDKIPIEGRALAVADTFDAMTSNRPYRKGLDPEIAIEEIEKCKGSQFDPECADAMIRAYNAGKIKRILQDYNKKAEKNIVCPFCSTFIALAKNAETGDIVSCDVCHREVRMVERNNAYYGELLPQSGTESLVPRHSFADRG